MGLIARAQPRHGGVLLGYFFGPRRERVPDLDQLRGLTAGDSVMRRLFSHLDIRQGRWPIIGRDPEWDRSRWPVPPFQRKPALGSAVLVTRSDDDPSAIVSETVIRDQGAEVSQAVPEGLLGSTLAAKLLDKKLNE